ncbi:MAG: SDR family oxidoreductase [Polyangiaceae bacterium]|nr:SDR family oxidoreductase [Polyangiaceae bacterium]
MTERELRGRHVVITGANTGIGRVTAERLAARGARVTVLCRSEERARDVLSAIRGAGGEVALVSCELGELASVHAAAGALRARGEPIHVLVNNAGVAGQRGETRDGFELQFGVNHLAHFALTMGVWPLLASAEGARIVNVSSRSHYQAKSFDWSRVRGRTRSISGLPEYALSKLANVLFTRETARRLGPSGVHSYSLHPGVVASDVWRRLGPLAALAKPFMLTNEQGAETTLYCACSPQVAEHDGRYYDACRERRASRLAHDDALARELWERSAEWAGVSAPAS